MSPRLRYLCVALWPVGVACLAILEGRKGFFEELLQYQLMVLTCHDCVHPSVSDTQPRLSGLSRHSLTLVSLTLSQKDTTHSGSVVESDRSMVNVRCARAT